MPSIDSLDLVTLKQFFVNPGVVDVVSVAHLVVWSNLHKSDGHQGGGGERESWKKIGEVMNWIRPFLWHTFLFCYQWNIILDKPWGRCLPPTPPKKKWYDVSIGYIHLFSLVEWPVNQAYMIGLFCKNCSGQYSKVIPRFGFLIWVFVLCLSLLLVAYFQYKGWQCC